MLDDILGQLNRCGVTQNVIRQAGDLECVPGDSATWRLSPELSMSLLAAARKELGTVRRQLTYRHVIWATLVHRVERAARRPFWRLRAHQTAKSQVGMAITMAGMPGTPDLPAGRGRCFPGCLVAAKTCCGEAGSRGRLPRWISAAPRGSGRRTGS